MSHRIRVFVITALAALFAVTGSGLAEASSIVYLRWCGGVVRVDAQVCEYANCTAPDYRDAHTLACKNGCFWCCYFTVDVRAVEVFSIPCTLADCILNTLRDS
jgi:hypothetical protein